ncbi:MAG: M48 family metallopeptidase [Bacteroidetes bacterium]|nr:M48 family metallopeptidase [Bacteroidota bacterium]
MHTLRKSNRAKHLRISIHPGGEVVVTIPRNISDKIVENFLQEKRPWIDRKKNLMEQYPKKTELKLSKKERNNLKEQTRIFVQDKLHFFNRNYKYSWNKISIREQKTRWGSCSQKKNLNFNSKIALLPEKLAEYIVVHELCHLGEFNHSKRFWNLVEKILPDYKQRRSDLKTEGIIFQ